ncbi:MAG: 50S ribosomal protein L25 [Deltaproteobacteria bacterium]|nr:50S ribosomal protein L25 [Deltaproteobacteria bacterium]
MIEKQAIKAEVREVGRKGILQELRNKGKVPAVLYGHDLEAVSFSVDGKELTRVIRGGGMNALIELQLAGYKGKGPLVVMIKDFQTDVVTHKMIHIDFLRVDMKEKLAVKVPVRLIGKAAGVEQGGLIEQSTRELEVKCLPGNIPEFLEIDISALNLGDSLHVTDLKLPEGVEAPKDVNITIVSVVAPKEEKAEEAAAAPVEGAAAAPAEGAAEASGAAGEAKGEAKEEKKEKEGKK